MKTEIHPRSARRALDKVQARREDAVHPAMIQRYLIRWAIGWSSVSGLTQEHLLDAWVKYTQAQAPPFVWLGRGLLLLGR